TRTSSASSTTWAEKGFGLERVEEREQVAFLRVGEAGLEDEVEELDGVVEGQQAAVVQVGGRVLDAAEREGLDRSVGAGDHPVDVARLVEALGAQVVHQVVGVIGGRVADAALRLVVEQDLPAPFLVAGALRV